MRGDRPEGRLLHPRRRQPDRRAAGGADPHPAPAGVGQRRLPAPDAAGARGPAGRAGRDAATARRDVAPTPRRAALAQALLMAADAGAGRPALGERRRGDLDGRRRRRSRGRRPVSVVVARSLAWLVLFSPAGPDRDRRGRRPAAAARRAARQLPARRLGAPAAVGGRAARRAVRRDRRLRRVVDHPLRPRARREDRQRRRPALRTARDRPAQDRARRGRGAGGGPRPATGSTATSCASARSGSAPGPRSARAARCCRARGSARVPRSRPGPRSPARSPPVSAGRARPRGGPASPACRWPSTRPSRSRSWALAYGVTSMLLGLLPAVAALPALAIVAVGVAGTASPAEATGGALLMVAPATVAYLVDVRAARPGRRAPARHRHARGLPPGAQPRGLAGLGHGAADGHGPHGPVPAVRQPVHAGVAAAARRQGRPRTSRRRRCSRCRR